MLRNHTLVPSIIDPEELVLLQRVFDKVCVRRGVAKDTPEATGIAEILIGIFQSGIRAEEQLLAMLSGARSYP